MNDIEPNMRASLVDFGTLVVTVNKIFYNGKIDTFYLLKDRAVIKELVIKEKKEYSSYFEYYFAVTDLKLDNKYTILCQYGLRAPVEYTRLVESPYFDEQFSYSRKDLGVTYYSNRCIFKLWAPTAREVHLKIFINQNPVFMEMKRDKDNPGVYCLEVVGMLDSCPYVYLVKHLDTFKECLDPYAYASLPNGKASVVVNQTTLFYDLKHKHLPELAKKNQAIIYETSIRDFTIKEGFKWEYPGKFLSFAQENVKTKAGNKIGIDYLADLGVTHVQLLPFFDFATVDEYNQQLIYNWGYDPSQYGIPEGSFVDDLDDPYARIRECQKMISQIHKKGLRVVMDVVFNHVYDTRDYAYEKIVPGYFLRRDENGNLSNGSWCGNDVNSQRTMVQRYIIDMCVRWQLLYGVDAFRFDLMGIIDIDTINKVYYNCIKYDNSFMVYGEGWNMGTYLPNEQKACQENYAIMTNIGFFNDYYRDTVRGSHQGGNYLKGYISGDSSRVNDAVNCLLATSRYKTSDQSINYIACHDNATLYDHLAVSNKDEVEATRRKRQMMATIFVLISQGIPFIHGGQEFYRTKQGIDNTYNASDEINAIDWSLVDEYQKDIQKIKEVIKIRKNNPGFWYNEQALIKEKVQAQVIDGQMIKYTINQDSDYKQLDIYINPSYQTYLLEYNDKWEILYSDGSNDLKEVKPISIMIIGNKEG